MKFKIGFSGITPYIYFYHYSCDVIHKDGDYKSGVGINFADVEL